MSWRFLDGDVAGRSSLRRGALKHRRRARPYVLRYAAAAVIVTILAALYLLAQTRDLPANGPLALFYWLHDTIWLTLRGHLWTALFPYALLWLVPLAGFVIVIATEWLTPAHTTGLQRKLVLAWLRLGSGHGFRLPVFHGGALKPPADAQTSRTSVGFRCQVVRDEWLHGWVAAQRRLRAGEGVSPLLARRLAMMAAAWARCDPADIRSVLAIAETLALVPSPEGIELARAAVASLAPSRAGVEREQPVAHGVVLQLARAIAEAPGDASPGPVLLAPVPEAPARRGSGALDVAGLAASCVAMGWAAGRDPDLAGLSNQWFADLARRRVSSALVHDSADAAAIEAAMALVDFEFWAGRAEAPSRRRPRGAWLERFAHYPDSAEAFAEEGALR